PFDSTRWQGDANPRGRRAASESRKAVPRTCPARGVANTGDDGQETENAEGANQCRISNKECRRPKARQATGLSFGVRHSIFDIGSSVPPWPSFSRFRPADTVPPPPV